MQKRETTESNGVLNDFVLSIILGLALGIIGLCIIGIYYFVCFLPGIMEEYGLKMVASLFFAFIGIISSMIFISVTIYPKIMSSKD
jgi:hypothetical protein